MNDLSRVRDLRKQTTAAESAAWRLLRNRQVLGLKFRRQCPLGPFVADFYCSEASLVIELDGGVHSQPGQIKKDVVKDRILGSMGLRLLRVANGLVLEDPEAFRRKVCEAAVGDGKERWRDPLTRPAPADESAGSEPPSPARGEGCSSHAGTSHFR